MEIPGDLKLCYFGAFQSICWAGLEHSEFLPLACTIESAYFLFYFVNFLKIVLYHCSLNVNYYSPIYGIPLRVVSSDEPNRNEAECIQ